MKFYLGTHEVSWLGRTDVPLFVSRRRLHKRKSFPRATGSWALDSGGFTELSMYGKWDVPVRQYVTEVRRFQEEIGGMEWAAPQDWMCEPHIIEKTGLSVEEHQWRTVDNLLALRCLAPDLPFVPVLQGWTFREYLNHAQMYLGNGIDLRREPLVGIGSVCRRQQTEGGREVIEHFASQGVRLHAFGLKLNGLREVGYLLASSDSLAWSFGARLDAPHPGCTHKTCQNCIHYALHWRQKVLARLSMQQPSLFVQVPENQKGSLAGSREPS